jgi:alpha-L-fucosidase
MIQPWFTEAKLGIFIHWGIYSVKPTGESWPIFNGEISYDDYMAQRHGFTASKYDPEAWARLFHATGAGYAVLTTKHHDGVALWDTAQNDLSVVKATPAGRDLIGPFCAALRKKRIKVGLYFSHLDWSHPDYATLPKDIPKNDTGDAAKPSPFNFRENNPEAWQRFLRFHRGQLKELCEQYHPDLLWFDGDWDRSAEQWRMAELRKQLHRWAPGVVLNSRMKGYGDYETPEQGLPIEAPETPWEFGMTANDHWGYSKTDKNYKSLRQILWYFIRCISNGGNLILDFGPKEDGTFPKEQIAILRGLARWNQKHAKAIFPTGRGLPLGHYDGMTTVSRDQKKIYLFCFSKPVGAIPLAGIRNKINSIRVLGSGTRLKWKAVGGAYWHGVPGVVWIDAPGASDLDPEVTVLEIAMDGPLNLFRGKGGAIEQN